MWIEGEAGIGKSRLMREFSSLMAAQGVFTWNGGCTARQTERAFSLFVDMMFQAFELQPTFSPEQIYRAIDQKLETWPIEIDAARPFMQWLLGVKPRGVPGERILSLEPEQLRRQIFIHFRKLFSTMAAHKPVLLFLDDLQWIDSISADLLMFLSHMITTHPLLVVGTLRSNENLNPESVLLQLMGMYSSQTVQLRIQPFTTLESQELLNKLFSRAKMPEATLALIVQQSGGNPYYIEEFVRMLLEQDFLRLKRGRLEVDQDFELDMLSVPSSLEALIRRTYQFSAQPGEKIDPVRVGDWAEVQYGYAGDSISNEPDRAGDGAAESTRDADIHRRAWLLAIQPPPDRDDCLQHHLEVAAAHPAQPYSCGVGNRVAWQPGGAR